MIPLPDITLVMTDTRCHELARLAVLDSMAECQFGDVLICSDLDFDVPGTRFHEVKDWKDKDEAQRFLWCIVPFLINTSHFLFVEWDAWVLDGSKWRDYFLDYDYIGAPWSWLKEGESVGNGGFSLRSTRMARLIANSPLRYPTTTPFLHDMLLGQEYRSKLEEDGFKFASEEVARLFSFETRHDYFDTFGFHAMFNWPMVISGNRLHERLRIARHTDHVIKTQGEHLARLPSWGP